jgi:hypothetical protein
MGLINVAIVHRESFGMIGLGVLLGLLVGWWLWKKDNIGSA